MAKRLLEADGTCLACARRCNLLLGAGLCGVRRLGIDGTLVVDGDITHAAVQPVEQKPLYHYRPGARLLTVGSWGCGTRCAYCRNADAALARRRPHATTSATGDLVARALACSDGLAFSFNEPLLRAEQVAATSAAAIAEGLEAVVVTSGWATEEVLELLVPVTTAWRLDVKAASEPVAERIFEERGTPWASAFRTLEYLVSASRHAEVSLTYSPSIHDEDELARLATAIVDASGLETPVHLQPLLPAHRLKDIAVPAVRELVTARRLLRRAGLRYVYVHLLGPAELRATRCDCGALLVGRSPAGVGVHLDAAGCCRACGAPSPIVLGSQRKAAA